MRPPASGRWAPGLGTGLRHPFGVAVEEHAADEEDGDAGGDADRPEFFDFASVVADESHEEKEADGGPAEYEVEPLGFGVPAESGRGASAVHGSSRCRRVRVQPRCLPQLLLTDDVG